MVYFTCKGEDVETKRGITYFGMWILCNTGIMFPRCISLVQGITRCASAPDQEVHIDSAKEIWLVDL